MDCALCSSVTAEFSTTHKRIYHRCSNCNGILLHPSYFLSNTEEKNRYQAHNNDVTDTGYRNFVSPIVESVLKKYTKKHKGLDFGSGSGPVVTLMLQDQGYDVQPYDPFFDPNKQALERKYDYIICCEVMEHFYNPAKEFGLLHTLLNPKGNLYCKTNLYEDSIDFNSWWYKNDSTHVFFYTKETLHWIKKQYQFSDVIITKELIVFKK
ncbi:class I SAM-dependent methyltransferase [Aquimarina sp. 2201CG14-23]|uniref:class I SAM-dependent methyltransferase n=1 Tax=Aquimarina mycalae TaxID=3040073 RepID=UPI002477F428|nr:class I SAM-dependent methyltransferase [Aquimarina sp. 2201CG14-23]MDH7447027.1 class I SAM-dependent methyltransferase [Aquimarina sp. 2201CG14-23]